MYLCIKILAFACTYVAVCYNKMYHKGNTLLINIKGDKMRTFKLKRFVTDLIVCTLVLSLYAPAALAKSTDSDTVITTVKSSAVKDGTLQTFNLKMVQFSDGRTRTIRVWLPKGYDSNNKSKKYPVLYMQDGQNLFDKKTSFSGEWHIDETISDYVNKGYQGSIVVGIDNGREKREIEYNPLKSFTGTVSDGDRYDSFEVNTVKPFIDAHYNTKPQREFTTVGGSSRGGDISIVLAMEHPDIFGYALVLSPYLPKDYISAFVRSNDFTKANNLPYLFIYSGGTCETEKYTKSCANLLDSEFLSCGYPKSKIKYIIAEKNSHNESAWSKYFKVAYKWIIDNPYKTIAKPGSINIPKSINKLKSINRSKPINKTSIPLITVCFGVIVVLIAVFVTLITNTCKKK